MTTKAVVSMVFGHDWWKLASVSFQALSLYAERLEADFIVITQRRFPGQHVHWEKLALREIVESYDRTFYADADAVVRPDAPSIFNLVPEGVFGAHDEKEESGRYEELIRTVNFYNAPRAVSSILRSRRHFNAGILVLSRCHAPIFNDPGSYISGGMPEQCYVNMRTHEMDVQFQHLDWTWNMIWGRHQTVEEAAAANVIHYAGLAKFGDGVVTLTKMMREDLARWGCPVL